jgi:hypothetical protein
MVAPATRMARAMLKMAAGLPSGPHRGEGEPGHRADARRYRPALHRGRGRRLWPDLQRRAILGTGMNHRRSDVVRVAPVAVIVICAVGPARAQGDVEVGRVLVQRWCTSCRVVD